MARSGSSGSSVRMLPVSSSWQLIVPATVTRPLLQSSPELPLLTLRASPPPFNDEVASPRRTYISRYSRSFPKKRSGKDQLSNTDLVQSRLLSLPLEVIYLIIDFIDEPYVLSQLALTSKSLHRFITFNHLYFRSIRCQWSQARIWDFFRTNAHIASRIRNLELVPDYSIEKPLLPPLCHPTMLMSYNHVPNQTHSVAIVKALANMINLTKLSWRISNRTGVDKELATCLGFALYYKEIRELHVSSRQVTLIMSPPLPRNLHQEASSSLDHLTRIDISFSKLNSFIAQNRRPTVTPGTHDHERLLDLIMVCCPKLEDFSLSIIRDSCSFSAPKLLTDGHWPNLRRLALKGRIFCLPENFYGSTIPDAFWSRHPNIESLLLSLSQAHHLNIQSGSLPKLKSLSGFLNPKFSTVAVDILARIEHLCDMTDCIPYRTPSPAHFTNLYFGHATSLTSLVLTWFDEGWQLLLSHHPTITRIAFRDIGYSSFPSRAFKLSENNTCRRYQSIFKTLSTLPRLTYLYHKMYPSFFFNASSNILLMLSQFPELRYVSGLDGHHRWCVLERNSEGMVTGWHGVEEFLSSQFDSFNEWGCNIRLIMERY